MWHISGCRAALPSAAGYDITPQRHPVDATTNSHTSLRIMNDTHNLLYAEFVNVTDPLSWNFTDDIQFTALYDLNADPWQLHNVYSAAPQPMKDQLRIELMHAQSCKKQTGSGEAPACP
jgi:hypothetical protein